ncbi:MAG: hypothetical protein AAF152_04030 [Cyanobacteria bacterium P01_A01_bin.114]
MALSEKVKDQTIRENIASDCAKLIDEHVSAKSGLSGMALKATYGMVKGIGADYVPGAIKRLLPQACEALDPMWAEGLQTGNPVDHLIQNRTLTADTILSVTDSRIQGTNNGIIRGAYNKLRKSVKSDVEEAVPGIAKIIGSHVQA